MGGKKYTYDAFLSYSRKDGPAVEYLARWLEDEAKLKVWLDIWNLVPGEPWQEKLEQGLDQCRCCVIFMGPGGLGNWQSEEIYVALYESISHKSIRVIPVLLPNTNRPEKESQIPALLRRRHWVAFKNKLDEPDTLKQLVCGIKGISVVRSAEPISADICPFRGLEVFREQDVPFFFGRESEVQQLVDYMESHRFIAVIGPSGSGKSSVVQAGLIPALKNKYCLDSDNKANSNLKIALFTPKERPLEELAFALRRLMQDTGIKTHTEDIIARLQKSENSLHYIAREICEATGTQQILLVVDQFEELFTQTGNEQERRYFINNIISASETAGGPAWIIFTMRSDFLGKCAAYPDLNTFVVDNLFQIGPMDEKNMARAIEEPAHLAGLVFEEGLVSDILKDASGAPGELPLVEHALLELYNKREGNKLTQKTYMEIGRIEGALTKRADIEYERLTPQQQEIIQKIFVLRLIQPGEGTEDTRRRATMEELLAAGENADMTAAVLKQWTDARLLTTMTDPLKKQEIVDVAHEALIRKWNKLQEWLAKNRETARLIDQLHKATDEWLRANKNTDYLYHGAQLAQVEDFFKFHAGDLTSREVEFIQESVYERDREVKLREQQQKKELETAQNLAKARKSANNRLLALATVVALALVLVSFLAFKLNYFLQESKRQLAFNFWENGRRERESGNLLGSLHYMAIATHEKPKDCFANAIVQDMSNALPDVKLNKILQHDDAVLGAVFSQDETRILTWSDDKTVRLWDAATGKQIIPSLQHDGDVRGAVFSKDAIRILTWSGWLGSDKTARLWDAATGKQLGPSLQHDDAVLGAVFSQDETRILTWGDETVRLWDTATGKQLGPSLQHGGGVGGAVFSKDETRILSWSLNRRSWDGTVHLWDLATGKQIIPSLQHDGNVRGAVFSKDETRILTWSLDNTARLWDAATGKQIGLSLQHNGDVNGAVFSKDETRILTWSLDNTARLWDAATGKQIIPSLQHDGDVRGAVFSKDETRILSWSFGGTVRLWDAKTGKRLGRALQHDGALWGAVFSKDETNILTQGNKTARLWDAKTGKQIGPSLQHDDRVSGAMFFKDGNRILTWSADKTVRLWDAAKDKPIGLSLQHDGAVSGAVFSNDEIRILSLSKDKTARLWDAATGKQIGLSLQHNGGVNGGVFSKDETRILTWSEDKTARLWDAATGKQIIPRLQHGGSVDGAVFSKDESRILTWSAQSWISDNTARLWDAATGKQIGPSLQHNHGVLGAVFSKDETRILTWSWDETARLWDATTGKQIGPSLRHDDAVLGAVFSNDASRILTRSGAYWDLDNTARLWDAATGEQIGSSLHHDDEVRGAVFSKDDTHILTCSADKTARLWNAATGIQIGPSLQHDSWINGAVFSKDETRILTWSYDRTARLWWAANLKQIGPSLQHDGALSGAVFSQDETRILTWSNDNTARLWDAATGKQLGSSLQHEGEVNGAVFSKDEKRILTWSRDSTARLWDVPGDMDFPKDKYILMVQALTGTEFDPLTYQIKTIPKDEWEKIREEYEKIASEHAKTCKYPRQNVYLRFLREEKK